MQTNYPSLPPENESTTSTNPPTPAASATVAAVVVGGGGTGAGRYPSSTLTSPPFPGSSAIDTSFSRCVPETNETTTSLNEVLHRSLMASSFTASEINEPVIPRAHSNGKTFDLNALREAASREKKLFERDPSERKEGVTGNYDFPFHMPTGHPPWPTHIDNHPIDVQPKSVQAPETSPSANAKLGSFSPNVGMLPYTNTGSTKDLDYFLAANAARALVNHLGGAGGTGSSGGTAAAGGSGSGIVPQPSDDRSKSPSMGFRDIVNPHISPTQQPSSMEPLYAHQRSFSDRSSPSRSSFGLPSLEMSSGAPPNMSVPFNSSPLPFPMPPNFRQNNPPYSPHPPHHLLPPNPFGGLDPNFADRMKDYSAPHHLMDPRFPVVCSMSRLPRSASPVDGDGRGGGIIGDSGMSDASPNSSSSGKFVSPHNQAGGTTGNGGNIVLYPWMNPKSCVSHKFYQAESCIQALKWRGRKPTRSELAVNRKVDDREN
ncbi:hypothetical protein EGR_02113 [Echinococcus granulosus]|uniref:Uncharacterized protein n=1 Tax=Echinococcus granulosus TaxID=6210 RepID=W6V901_ECHGR|nr:hypothetical protein EGR_02113 [Echinococcus granulosus]EUB63019.1 hypothetical protein EGR_02113 [Echinococcus granulosus]